MSGFNFDTAVTAADNMVFQILGKAAIVYPAGQDTPLPEPIRVLVDQDYRAQSDDGQFGNVYGNRVSGLTYDAYFIEFQKRELQTPTKGMVFELPGEDSYRLDEVIGQDQYTFIYAALKI